MPRGKPFTPEEDALILKCPKVPGATENLAIRLGRSAASISTRRSALSGTRNYQRNPNMHDRKKTENKKERSNSNLPLDRPAFFSEPNIESRLMGSR